LAALRGKGESGRAAQLCAAWSQGGYADWFLPSIDELNQMYKNLRVKGFGGFRNDSYWSSSQFDNKYAWIQYFVNGTQGGNYRNRRPYVRAVRAF
jgi:hypothetical protein